MAWSKSVEQQLQRISQQGMQQAAETFSRLLRQPVAIAVADAWLSTQTPIKVLPESSGIGVYMEIAGDFSGGLLLFLDEECAHWLAVKLLRCGRVADLLAEPASSTLKEIGNIISSAFLASLDDQLQLRSLPHPPVLSRGAVAELLARYQPGSNESCLVVHTHLTGGEKEPAALQCYLILNTQTMTQLAARIAAP